MAQRAGTRLVTTLDGPACPTDPRDVTDENVTSPAAEALTSRDNFAASVFATSAGRGDKPAYIDDAGTTTYAELEASARRFASVLRERGVRPEERVVVLMHDTVDLPTVFLGALYAGVVPVLLNTLLSAADYAFMLEHSSARLVIASSALLPIVKDALCAAKSDVPVIVSTRASSPLSESDALLPRLGDRLAQAMPLERPVDSYADDIAFWLYSSGSTGRPKATVHSHANIFHTVELYARPILGMREDDVVFSAAKLFFAYGLGIALTFPLSVGATTILMTERPTPDAVFDRLTRHKPTVFGGVPTLYLSMLASPRLPARADVALRVCTSAGETLPERVGTQFTSHFGCFILDGLGSTEMLHIYLSNRPGDVVYGTTGKPVPGYDIELRDDAGALVPPGEVGDLYVKGPSAALLYWRDRERSRATFQGPWTKTGDRYRMLPSGHYVYAGRSDDMLKVSGQYVAPVEVELALQEHEAVLEAAVVGRQDDNGLVRIFAYVVLRIGHTGDDPLRLALQAWVKQRLLPHKYPREIVFLPELPKTATGKIQRFKLRA
jgi:benzoate-CoA ligase